MLRNMLAVGGTLLLFSGGLLFAGCVDADDDDGGTTVVETPAPDADLNVDVDSSGDSGY